MYISQTTARWQRRRHGRHPPDAQRLDGRIRRADSAQCGRYKQKALSLDLVPTLKIALLYIGDAVQVGVSMFINGLLDVNLRDLVTQPATMHFVMC